jgi:hypothetical protein
MQCFFDAKPLPEKARSMLSAEARGDPVLPAAYVFAKSNNKIWKKVDGESVTFCSYGGLYGMGRIVDLFTDHALREFARCIASDFRMRTYYALTENKRKGHTCRMYFDYDFKTSVKPPENLWEKMEKLERRVVASFYPGLPVTDSKFESTVLTCGCTKIKNKAPDSASTRAGLGAGAGAVGQDERPWRVKSGIHVIYKNLYVTADQAMHIACAVKHVMMACLGTEAAEAGLSLEDCVDLDVYGTGRGLRWAWQLKTFDCPECKPKSAQHIAAKHRRAMAAHGMTDGFTYVRPASEPGPGSGSRKRMQCGNPMCYNGVIPDVHSSMYSPAYVCKNAHPCYTSPLSPPKELVATGPIDALGRGLRPLETVREWLPECRLNPTMDLLLQCSLLHYASGEPTGGFVVPAFAPPKPVPVTKKMFISEGGAADGVQVAVGGVSEPVKTYGRAGKDLEVFDHRVQLLQNIIRRGRGGDVFADVSVTKVCLKDSGTTYLVNCMSRRCLKKGENAYHDRAGVYFYVKESKVEQACWSSHCRSKARVSWVYELSVSERASLFPAMKAPARKLALLPDGHIQDGSVPICRAEGDPKAALVDALSRAPPGGFRASFTPDEALKRGATMVHGTFGTSKRMKLAAPQE